MVSIEKGRVCKKTSGRDKGKRCVVVNVTEDHYVEVLCKGRKKRRKCNRKHLDPTDGVVEVKSDEEVIKSL